MKYYPVLNIVIQCINIYLLTCLKKYQNNIKENIIIHSSMKRYYTFVCFYHC